MTDDKLYVANDLYLSVEIVAQIFEVESLWLLQVCESGLLDNSVQSAPKLHIAAIQMDRVATIVRLHTVLGLEIEAIALALDD